MVKPMDDEALRSKFGRWREKYVNATNEAKRANLETGAAKKESLDAIYTQVENAGGKALLKAFKNAMTTMDHWAKAVGKRDDVVQDEDSDILNAFDRLMVLTPEILPLFTAATQEQMRQNAAKEPDDSNVVEMESAA